MFLASGLASLAFIVAYIATPVDDEIPLPGFGSTNASNLLLGITMGLALFLIGAAAIHWAKKLMPDVEVVQERAPEESTERGTRRRCSRSTTAASTRAVSSDVPSSSAAWSRRSASPAFPRSCCCATSGRCRAPRSARPCGNRACTS